MDSLCPLLIEAKLNCTEDKRGARLRIQIFTRPLDGYQLQMDTPSFSYQTNILMSCSKGQHYSVHVVAGRLKGICILVRDFFLCDHVWSCGVSSCGFLIHCKRLSGICLSLSVLKHFLYLLTRTSSDWGYRITSVLYIFCMFISANYSERNHDITFHSLQNTNQYNKSKSQIFTPWDEENIHVNTSALTKT